MTYGHGLYNFISHTSKKTETLFYFHPRVIQNPTSMKYTFHILDWLKSGNFTSQGFTNWIEQNFKRDDEHGNPIKPEIKEVSHPYIYYPYIANFSYIFDANTGAENKIVVYEWEESIFSGSVESFFNFPDRYAAEGNYPY